MDNKIYRVDFDVSSCAYLFAIVSAKSEEKARGLLEKKIGSILGFKIWGAIDRGFKSDKEGIIEVGIYNDKYSRLASN